MTLPVYNSKLKEGRNPKKSDHGCKRLYSKDEIQRYLPLDVKLDKILPGICSVCSPQGTKLWQNYVWLKKLRDCCIHLKSSDWQHSGPENAPNYFWTKLMSRKVQKAPEFAFSLIQHYYPQDQPRWMRKFSLFSDPIDSIRESVRVG